MSYWNYRVIEFVDPNDNEPWRAIHEVHYDDDGRPELYTEDASVVMSHDQSGAVAGLGWVLDRMREALDRPMLIEADFAPRIAPTPPSASDSPTERSTK